MALRLVTGAINTPIIKATILTIGMRRTGTRTTIACDSFTKDKSRIVENKKADISFINTTYII